MAGDSIKVGSVVKEALRQVANFQTAVQQFARRTLNDAGKRIRRRMIDERLSGIKYARKTAPKGAPLARKTGRLIRSLFYKPQLLGDNVTLLVGIGAGGVYYADTWEAEGRLQFSRIAILELEAAREELRIGFAFLAKNPGVSLGTLSAESAAIEAPASALQAGLREAWSGRGEYDRQRRERGEYSRRFRALRQKGGRLARAKTSGRRAFREATSGFEAFGIMGSGRRLRMEKSFGGKQFIKATRGFGAFGL